MNAEEEELLIAAFRTPEDPEALLCSFNPATRDLFSLRGRFGSGPPPLHGLTQEWCSFLLLRAATEHHSFRGLAREVSINPGTLTRVLKREAPPPISVVRLIRRMLTSTAPLLPFDPSTLAVRFADLAPRPRRSRDYRDGGVPLCAWTDSVPVEMVPGIDRLVLTGTANVEAMHARLSELSFAALTPSVAGEISAALRWVPRTAARLGEAWSKVRRDVIERLPFVDDHIIVDGRIIPVRVRTSTIETQKWERRARKFHRVMSVEDMNGVQLALCGYAAFGPRQNAKGDIWIDVAGTACARGLLGAIVSRFFTPYVRPGMVAVDEIHLFVDVNRPARSVVVSFPSCFRTTITFEGGVYYGGISSKARVCIYDKKKAAIGDENDRNVSEFPAHARGWAHAARIEYRFKLGHLPVDQRRPHGIVASMIERCARYEIADLGVLAPDARDAALLRAATALGLPSLRAPNLDDARRRADERHARKEKAISEAKATGKQRRRPNGRQREVLESSVPDVGDWFALNLGRVCNSNAEVNSHALVLLDRVRALLDAAHRATPYEPAAALRASASALDAIIARGLFSLSTAQQIQSDAAAHAAESQPPSPQPAMTVSPAAISTPATPEIVTQRGPYKRPSPAPLRVLRSPQVDDAGQVSTADGEAQQRGGNVKLFRFSAEELGAFVPTEGAILVGYDKTRPRGARLYEIQAFGTREAGEDALAVTDVPCLLSLPCDPRPPAQLDLFPRERGRRRG